MSDKTIIESRALNLYYGDNHALKDISIRAGKQAEERLQNAIGKIEPTMTAILSVLTGLILVSVMLPLLSIMAGIG